MRPTRRSWRAWGEGPHEQVPHGRPPATRNAHAGSSQNWVLPHLAERCQRAECLLHRSPVETVESSHRRTGAAPRAHPPPQLAVRAYTRHTAISHKSGAHNTLHDFSQSSHNKIAIEAIVPQCARPSIRGSPLTQALVRERPIRTSEMPTTAATIVRSHPPSPWCRQHWYTWQRERASSGSTLTRLG